MVALGAAVILNNNEGSINMQRKQQPTGLTLSCLCILSGSSSLINMRAAPYLRQCQNILTTNTRCPCPPQLTPIIKLKSDYLRASTPTTDFHHFLQPKRKEETTTSAYLSCSPTMKTHTFIYRAERRSMSMRGGLCAWTGVSAQ